MTLLERIKRDTNFRTKSFLFCSLVLNFSYALFLFLISRLYNSPWFFITAVYYAFLFLIRFFMFLQVNSKQPLQKKIKTMRTCGYFLFLINVAVSIMIYILIFAEKPVKHHEITVITIAVYVFSSFTVSIIGSIRYVKQKLHVYSCVKVISLISASVSMITLTDTMLITFGEGNIMLRQIILPILSFYVSVLIIVCAIIMITKANSNIRSLQNE